MTQVVGTSRPTFYDAIRWVENYEGVISKVTIERNDKPDGFSQWDIVITGEG